MEPGYIPYDTSGNVVIPLQLFTSDGSYYLSYTGSGSSAQAVWSSASSPFQVPLTENHYISLTPGLVTVSNQFVTDQDQVNINLVAIDTKNSYSLNFHHTGDCYLYEGPAQDTNGSITINGQVSGAAINLLTEVCALTVLPGTQLFEMTFSSGSSSVTTSAVSGGPDQNGYSFVLVPAFVPFSLCGLPCFSGQGCPSITGGPSDCSTCNSGVCGPAVICGSTCSTSSDCSGSSMCPTCIGGVCSPLPCPVTVSPCQSSKTLSVSPTQYHSDPVTVSSSSDIDLLPILLAFIIAILLLRLCNRRSGGW